MSEQEIWTLRAWEQYSREVEVQSHDSRFAKIALYIIILLGTIGFFMLYWWLY